MESFKIKLPRYTRDQELIKLRINAGILLKDEHYSILVDDAITNLNGTQDVDKILKYLRIKYGTNFSRSRIIEGLKNANLQ